MTDSAMQGMLSFGVIVVFLILIAIRLPEWIRVFKGGY